MRKSEGVSVMKDKEIKLVEIETSHTLGGSGEGRVPPNTRKVIKSLYFLLKKWSVDPPTRSLSSNLPCRQKVQTHSRVVHHQN